MSESMQTGQTGAAQSHPELIEVAETVARDKGIEREVVFEAMEQAIDETNRRREVQEAYNKKHNITPTTIIKAIKNLGPLKEGGKNKVNNSKKGNIKDWIRDLNGKLDIAVQNMEFEKAADIKDEIDMLKQQAL